MDKHKKPPQYKGLFAKETIRNRPMRNYIKILTRATLIYAIICAGIITRTNEKRLISVGALISQAATEPPTNGILVAVYVIIAQIEREV